MPLDDDNGDLIFEQSRLADVRAEQAQLRNKSLDESVARVKAGIEARRAERAEKEAAAAPTSETDETPERPEALSAGLEPAVGFDASRGQSFVRSGKQESGELSIGPQPTSFLDIADDIRKAVPRGIITEVADALDNLSNLDFGSGGDASFQSIARFLEEKGVEFPSASGGERLLDFAGNELTLRETVALGGKPLSVRGFVEKEFGKPQTTAGEVIQPLVGQLALLLPAMQGLRIASFMSRVLKSIVAPAAVFALTLEEGEPNVSEVATTLGKDTVFDNKLTQFLSTSTDDTTAERLLKTMGEGILIAGAAEGVVAKVGSVVRTLRGSNLAAEEIAGVAEQLGAAGDDTLNKLSREFSVTKTEVDVLEATRKDQIVRAKALKEASEQADEVARFRGERSPAEAQEDIVKQLSDDLDDLRLTDEGRGGTPSGETERVTEELSAAQAELSELAQGQPTRAPAVAIEGLEDDVLAETERQLTSARGRLAQTEASLQEIAAVTKADARVVEATRQTLAKHGLSKETDKALGDAATRLQPEVPPMVKKVIYGNYLEANAEDALLLQQQIKVGDIDEAIKTLGTIYDSTNYDRLIASGGVEDLLKMIGAQFGNSSKSMRLQTSRSFATTEKMAIEMIGVQAEKAGTSPERLFAALERSLPGANLDVQINALRIAELSLAEKVMVLSREIGESATATDLGRAEFTRWAIVLANVNDRRAGVVSNIARALSAQRIKAKSVNFDNILKVSKTLRDDQVKGILDSAGGAKRVSQLAEIVRQAPDADTAARHVASLIRRETIGDFLYTAYIANLLSSFSTDTINTGSNLIRGILFNPIEKGFEQGAVAFYNNDPGAFAIVASHIYGMGQGAKVALIQSGAFIRGSARATIKEVGPLKAFKGGGLAKSFKSGLRQTAGQRVGFLEDVKVGLLRSESLGDLIQRGAPASVPLGGFGEIFPPEAKTLFFVPQKTLTNIGDYLIKRTGVGAKAVDYTGRVLEFPTKSLAAADELAASISYHGQLAADTAEHARGLNLSPEETTKLVDRLRRDVPNVELLASRADPNDAQRVDYLKLLQRFDDRAGDYARRSTYTDLPGKVTSMLVNMRRALPILRWTTPFIRTPINLATSGIRDFTPIGPIAELMKLEGTGASATEIAKVKGRLVMTSGIAYQIWDSVNKGVLTGGLPHNFEERELAKLTKTPYSLKFDAFEHPIRINRLDPIAMPMMIGADLMELQDRMEEKQYESLQAEFWNILLEQMKSKAVLQGLSQMAEVIENPDAHLQRLFVSTTANLVPGSAMFRSLKRGGLPIPDDLVLEEADDSKVTMLLKDFIRGDRRRALIQREGSLVLELGSTIQANLPESFANAFTPIWQKIMAAKLNDSVTPTLNEYGEVVALPAALGPDIASPFLAGNGTPQGDPLSAERSRIGGGISVPRRFGKILGVQLSPAQQNKFVQLYAKPKNQPTIRELMNRLVFEDDGVTFTAKWLKLGEPVGRDKGGKHDELAKIIALRMNAAKLKLRAGDKVLDDQLKQIELDSIVSLGSKGTDATRERLQGERQENSILSRLTKALGN